MVAGKFKKQGYEEWLIDADFSENMDIEGGEDLDLSNCTVVAVDVDDTDVSATILDAATMAIGTGIAQGRLFILARAGTVAASPYKITFKSGDTIGVTVPERWEKDVKMTIKEI